jgi:hypothetical protein
MKTRLITTIILSALFLGACQSKAIPQTATITPQLTATLETATSIPATQANEITIEQIGNAKVLSPQTQKEVQLKEGKYEGGSGPDYMLVQLQPQSAIGDLNGDGKADAAVLLSENDGGSGVFVSLVVFIANEKGFSQSTPMLVDDRPIINQLTIKNGIISLDAAIHDVNDTMVAPTLKIAGNYQLYGNKIIAVGLSETSGDVKRSIQIDSPIDRAQVSGTVEVKGSMPAAPFENTLRFRFYDASGSALSEGSFMVKADDMGKPATFDNVLTLPQNPSGGLIRFELADLSAKDGSALALASVELVLK